jgi:hypothetical protein
VKGNSTARRVTPDCQAISMLVSPLTAIAIRCCSRRVSARDPLGQQAVSIPGSPAGWLVSMAAAVIGRADMGRPG